MCVWHDIRKGTIWGEKEGTSAHISKYTEVYVYEMYVYTYIYTKICMYVYIYIHIWKYHHETHFIAFKN